MKVLVLSFLFLALGILVFTQYDTPKFQVLLGKSEQVSSLSRRAQIYEFNIKAAKDNIFLGIGPGAYQSFFRLEQGEYLNEIIPEKEIPPHPHNLFFAFVFDLGILGGITLLALYALVFVCLLRIDKYPYFLPFAYFLLHGFLDTPYGLEEFSVLFWIFYALLILKSNYQNDSL